MRSEVLTGGYCCGRLSKAFCSLWMLICPASRMRRYEMLLSYSEVNLRVRSCSLLKRLQVDPFGRPYLLLDFLVARDNFFLVHVLLIAKDVPSVYDNIADRRTAQREDDHRQQVFG